jgi:hypothetical protein
MPWLAGGLALGAAALFAVGAVAQQQAAADQPDARGLRLMLALLASPRWLAATFGNMCGYALQACALAAGSLLVVQPILITTLVFALPLGARWNHRVIAHREIGWAVALCVALATFLLAGSPEGGRNLAPLGDWWSSIAICGGMVIVAGTVAMLNEGKLRALCFAIVAGTCVGFASALTKSVVARFGNDIMATFGRWELYALVGAAALGIFAQQLAFQAGSLEVSFPATMILDPVVAMFVAINTLHERVRASGVEWLLIVVSAVILVAGTIALGRAGVPTGRLSASSRGVSPDDRRRARPTPARPSPAPDAASGRG